MCERFYLQQNIGANLDKFIEKNLGVYFDCSLFCSARQQLKFVVFDEIVMYEPLSERKPPVTIASAGLLWVFKKAITKHCRSEVISFYMTVEYSRHKTMYFTVTCSYK